MSAINTLENTALEYALQGDFATACDIYEKLARNGKSIAMACQYVICAYMDKRTDDSLRMIDTYGQMLNGKTRPDYTEFYTVSSVLLYNLGQYKTAYNYAERATVCDPDCNVALFQRMACEQTLGMTDTLSLNGDRMHAYLTEVANGVHGRIHGINPFQVGCFFADSELMGRIAMHTSAEYNELPRLPERTPTIADLMTKKIKVGYLCGHVRNHPTIHLLWNVLKHHNKDRFETHGFVYAPNYEYEGTKVFLDSLDTYTDITQYTDAQSAQIIYDAEIDVLIDLTGLIEGNRMGIVARKPAPVIMNYMGYGATTGVDAVDYTLTDAYTTPATDSHNYTEKMAYLPQFYMPGHYENAPTLTAKQRRDARVENGLPADGIVFSSMNQPYKWTAQTVQAWMTILHNVPDSVLWLLQADTDISETMMRIDAENFGIDPNRIIFAPTTDKPTHMKRLPLADIYLDTDVVSGHTTMVDNVCAGVVPIAMQGSHFYSRFGASVLLHLGCPNLIADDHQEYVQMAVHLARTPDDLAQWKNRIAQTIKSTGMLDIKTIIPHLDNAIDMAYMRWASNLPPQDFVATSVDHDTPVIGESDYSISPELMHRIYGDVPA